MHPKQTTITTLAIFLLTFLSSTTAYLSDVNDQAYINIEAAKQSGGDAEKFAHDVLMMEKFEGWMGDFEKEYESDEEKLHRFEIWLEHDQMIDEHNNQDPPPSFKMGHNQFSDMTQEEVNSMHGFTP